MFKTRGRLDVDRITFIRIFVENLSFKPIGIGGQPVAQGARRGSGRGANASHQGKRAPECQPPAALIRSCALDHAEAVIKHCVVKCTMSIGKFVGAFCGFVAREYALLAPIASSNVDPPPLHEVSGKPRAILFAFERAFGKTWID